MEIIIQRIRENQRATGGILYLDGVAFCHCLENPFQQEKIEGQTRIPAGRYALALRQNSPMAQRYAKRYGTHGMPWLLEVPGFEHIYLHVGNSEKDTKGCILVGKSLSLAIEDQAPSQRLASSTPAYKALHQKIALALSQGQEVFCTLLNP